MAELQLEDFIPPPDLFAASKRYAEVGRAFFDALVEAGELRAGERVLDVGCGTGRIAVPLVDYLGPEGSYEGFDRNAARIEWCNSRIAPLHPGFRFQAVDVFNSGEAPRDVSAGAFTFPYSDADFDLVFLHSVFTHMLPDGVERYLSEIARVLRPSGRTVITWILLNEKSLRALDEQQDRRHDPASNVHKARLAHDFGVYRVSDPENPSTMVAYDEQFARETYERSGFEIDEPIRYGSWMEPEATLWDLDLVVARRR